MATIFTLGIGLAGVPTGFLLDRLSRKAVVLIGIAIYSGFTVLTGFGLGFGDLFAYRALSGVGEAMQNAALFSAVGAYFFAHRALAIGSLNFAYGVGGFIGPIFGAGLAASFGSWRVPFFVFGAIGVAFVAIIAVFVRRRFTEQVEPVDPDRTADHVVDIDDSVPQHFWNRNTILLGLTAVVVGLAMYGFIGLYPSFLQKQLHFGLRDAGLIASMFGLGAMMGLPAGYLMDRLNVRNVLITAMLIGSGVGYLIFNGPTTVGWQFVLSFAEGAVASGFCSSVSTPVCSARYGRHSSDVVGVLCKLFLCSGIRCGICLFAASRPHRMGRRGTLAADCASTGGCGCAAVRQHQATRDRCGGCGPLNQLNRGWKT